MRKQSPFRVFLTIVCIVTCIFLSACGGGTGFASAEPTPVPTCVPPHIPNLYTDHDVEEVVAFYQTYINNFGNVGVLENLRKEAFLRLVELAQYESATHVLSRDQFRTVRATVTLLDPALIQYVILNQMLFNISSNNLFVASDDSQYGIEVFRGRVRDAMTDIAEREEILFLVTVTFSAGDPLVDEEFVVEIPFEDMVLINTSDDRIPSTHDDHNLGARMEIGNNMVSGLVSFPLGLGVPGQCRPLLDAWNTTLTLEVTGIQLGTKTLETTMWTVPFNPLIRDDFIHHGDPFYHSNQYGNLQPTQITSISVPPTPAWDFNSVEEYWKDTSKYIWHVIVALSHH